ncbi:MAG: hypothetical protein IKM43_00085 [Clostridia bacterium]|nr:hypothetical protein [Clostridia bacterium]
MYYCKDLYSLSILSLYEGELLGVVDKLYFDKKMKKLLEIELINDEGVRLTLSTKNIYHIGKNAITIKNNQAVSLKVEENNLQVCPIMSKAYSLHGEYLGIIKDVTLSDKFLTEKFSLEDNSTLDITRLASCGKNTVIFFAETEKINLQKFTPTKTPKIFKTEPVQVAKILPVEIQPSTNAEPVESPAKPTVQISDFLLGRICTKDIFNFNNELLIKAHSIVNKKNLKEINKFGKLRELMLYSK